ncbi:MAG: hypothetical protein ACOYO1_13220 [Bacteroidales bacterium]
MNNKLIKISILILIATLSLGSCKKEVSVNSSKKINSKETVIVDLKLYTQNFKSEVYLKESSLWDRFKKGCAQVLVVASADLMAGVGTAAGIVYLGAPAGVTPLAPGLVAVAAAGGAIAGAGASIATGQHVKSMLFLENIYLKEIDSLCSNSENNFDYIGKNHNYLLNYYAKSSQPEISIEMLNNLLNEYMINNNMDESSLIVKREDILNLAYNSIKHNLEVPYQANNITNLINNNYQDSYDKEMMIIYFNKISTIESVNEFLEYTKGYEHIIISSIEQESYSNVLSSLSIARFSVGYWVTSGELLKK